MSIANAYFNVFDNFLFVIAMQIVPTASHYFQEDLVLLYSRITSKMLTERSSAFIYAQYLHFRSVSSISLVQTITVHVLCTGCVHVRSSLHIASINLTLFRTVIGKLLYCPENIHLSPITVLERNILVTNHQTYCDCFRPLRK